MSDYCKHGLAMDIPCRKCGRTRVVEVPNFEAKRNSFTDSIGKLEETVRQMQQELASPASDEQAPARTEPEPVATAPLDAETAPDEDVSDPAAPTPAPQHFPWQRG